MCVLRFVSWLEVAERGILGLQAIPESQCGTKICRKVKPTSSSVEM